MAAPGRDRADKSCLAVEHRSRNRLSATTALSPVASLALAACLPRAQRLDGRALVCGCNSHCRSRVRVWCVSSHTARAVLRLQCPVAPVKVAGRRAVAVLGGAVTVVRRRVAFAKWQLLQQLWRPCTRLSRTRQNSGAWLRRVHRHMHRFSATPALVQHTSRHVVVSVPREPRLWVAICDLRAAATRPASWRPTTRPRSRHRQWSGF